MIFHILEGTYHSRLVPLLLYSNYSLFQEDFSFSRIVIGKFEPVFSPKKGQNGHKKSTGTIRCFNHKLLKINQ